MSVPLEPGIEARITLSHPGFVLELDVSIPGRGVTALFGPSGSGKTSCLRALAGLQRGRGRLMVRGEVWQDDARRVFVPTHRRALGYVFQDSALFPHLTVRGNLEFGHQRVPPSEQRTGFEQAVALLGLEALLERSTTSLSGGERQRVAIGRALAASPRLLLLDEPMASLDQPRRAELLPFLLELQARLDIPALYVSHAPDEVAQLASHLVVLERGQVLASGPTAELMTRLDLALAHGDSAQAVLDVVGVSHDPQAQLMRVAFAGGELLLPARGGFVGASRRVRVAARDVSLALSRHGDTSILNILPATVLAVADDTPGHAMVRLEVGVASDAGASVGVGGCVLLARISRQSVQALGVRPGLAVFAQIKGAAISA